MDLTEATRAYFEDKYSQFGNSPRGVDWGSDKAQRIRFDMLMRVLPDKKESYSINDIGCGYGEMVRYLREQGYQCRYHGYDLVEAYTDNAQSSFGHDESCAFTQIDDVKDIACADYSVASGIFNMKMDCDTDRWKAYICETIEVMDSKSTVGFAFNMLTSYSDEDKKRGDLYYGDPKFFIDHCIKKYSMNVELVHHYGLWDFSIIVRKSGHQQY